MESRPLRSRSPMPKRNDVLLYAWCFHDLPLLPVYEMALLSAKWQVTHLCVCDCWGPHQQHWALCCCLVRRCDTCGASMQGCSRRSRRTRTDWLIARSKRAQGLDQWLVCHHARPSAPCCLRLCTRTGLRIARLLRCAHAWSVAGGAAGQQDRAMGLRSVSVRERAAGRCKSSTLRISAPRHLPPQAALACGAGGALRT